MTCKLRALGLALVAVFAMSALSAASASAIDFHSEFAHTMLSGEQHAGEDVFNFNAGTARCSHATYTGTEGTATSTILSIIPSYTGCKAFGDSQASIHTKDCSLTFDSNANNVDIACGADPLTITSFFCWVTIGDQNNLGVVTYTNQGSGSTRDVTIDINITGITYTQHKTHTFGCTNGTFTNGTYTGSITLRGTNTSGTQGGFWVQ